MGNLWFQRTLTVIAAENSAQTGTEVPLEVSMEEAQRQQDLTSAQS